MNYPKHLPYHITKHFHASEIIGNASANAYYHYFPEHKPYYGYLPMHSHDFYEINILVEGTVIHYIENKIIPTPTGTVFILPPSVNHGYYSDKNARILHILLHPGFMASYIIKNQKILKDLVFCSM